MKRFLFIALGVLLSATVTAGAAARGPGDDADRRVVRFRLFSPVPIRSLGYLDGASPMARGTGAAEEEANSPQMRPIDLQPTSFTPWHEFRGRGPVILTDTATGDALASFEAPENGSDFSVLIVPDGNRRRYDVRVLDPELLKRRGPLIGNFSQLRLSGSAGDGPLELSPGEVVEVPSGAGGIRVLLQAEFNGRKYQSVRETIPADPGIRRLLLLFPPIRPGSIEVQWRMLILE